MRTENFGHLKHGDFVLFEQNFELLVTENESLVLLILQLVLFDICPYLFGHLWPGKLAGVSEVDLTKLIMK